MALDSGILPERRNVAVIPDRRGSSHRDVDRWSHPMWHRIPASRRNDGMNGVSLQGNRGRS